MRSESRPVVSRDRIVSIALLVVGGGFLLVSVFQSNIWFDESYSVAIASHSFSEIWSIGSHDVHPVLYYWMLHLVYLAFGSSIIAFRLFSVLGSMAMAVLGVTCVAKDFGRTTGWLFAFLSLFVPVVGFMCLQVRMYSWASFSVALTAVFACRIALATSRAADEKSVAAPGGGEVPAGWWVVLFGASLASAYLHYYAAIAAFLVNVFLLVVLLRYRGTCKRRIRTFLCGAVVTVACYLPWVMALAGQVSHVSGGFWIEMSFPGTAYDILDYLVLTPAMLEAVGGSCGNVLQALATIVSVAVAVCAAALSGWMVVQLWRHVLAARAARRQPSRKVSPADPALVMAWCGMGVYGGIIAIALAVSLAMGQAVLYFRYLYVALCFPLFFFSVALSRVDRRQVTGVVCGLTLAASVISQAVMASDYYAAEDHAAVDYYVEKVQELSGDTGGALVVSDNIGISGVLAQRRPDISIEYLDVYTDTAQAYEAYAPTIGIVESLHDTLDDYSGRYVVLETTDVLGDDQSVYDFAEEYDSEVVEIREFVYPYTSEDGIYIVAVLER